MFDLQKRLDLLRTDFESSWQKLKLDEKLANLKTLEEEVAVPEIWNNPDNAREKTKKLPKSRTYTMNSTLGLY